MSSNLKVNTILPSAGTTIGIGTAGGSITITNGRLGVGTDTPLQRLHIRGEGEGNHLLYLQGGDTICDIVQSDNGGSTRLRSANGSFYVWTGGDGNSSTGANGSPAIHVNTSLETKFYNTIKIPDRIQQDGYTHTAIRFPAAHTITFETDQNERLRITPTGTVGIGVTNPDAKLEVRDSGSTGIIVRCTSTQSTDTNKALRVRNNSDTNTFSVSHRGQGYFAGKVGIKETNPDSELEINRGSEGKYMTVGGDDASNGRGLSFTSSEGGTGSNGALHTINAKSGNGAIALATAGTERFRVEKNGYITMPFRPAFKCHIHTQSSPNSGVVSENNGFTLNATSYRDAFNNGSHFSEATGRFTAPVTGLYFFHFSLMRYSNNGNGSYDIRIKKNNSLILARSYKAGYTQNFESLNVTTITNMTGGHYVTFNIGSSMSTYEDDSYMLGYLLG